MQPGILTPLFREMVGSGRYTPSEAQTAIQTLRECVADGGCPENLLAEIGMSQAHLYDLIGPDYPRG